MGGGVKCVSCNWLRLKGGSGRREGGNDHKNNEPGKEVPHNEVKKQEKMS